MSHFRGLSLQNITLITEITFQVLAMDGKTFWDLGQKKGIARIHLTVPRLTCDRYLFLFRIIAMQHFKYTSQNSGVFRLRLRFFSQSKLEHLWESIFLQAFSTLSTHVLNGIIHAEKYIIYELLLIR